MSKIDIPTMMVKEAFFFSFLYYNFRNYFQSDILPVHKNKKIDAES